MQQKKENFNAYNEPSADNAGSFRMLAFTEPTNDKGKQK